MGAHLKWCIDSKGLYSINFILMKLGETFYDHHVALNTSYGEENKLWEKWVLLKQKTNLRKWKKQTQLLLNLFMDTNVIYNIAHSF